MNEHLLIIEDETLFAKELKRHFGRCGWDVAVAPTLGDAEALLFDPDSIPLVVIADMNLPDGNALDLLERARKKKILGEWIFLTGFGGVPDSVRAMQLGAHEFLEKPCERDRLDVIVASARRSALAQRTLSNTARHEASRYQIDAFVGNSDAASEMRRLLARLAETPLSALIISGESGTGKGLAARILHYGGTRCEGPLIQLNCAALPKDLLESELFGHEAGAFTDAKARRQGLIEQANDGTLFLDEIGEMPLDLQAKLLKVIEDRTVRRLGSGQEIKVNVQFLAATNKNLRQAVEEGDFREDLYHRLNVFKLELPPLRQRKGDLYELVPQILSDLSAQTGITVTEIPDETWNALMNHDWPGNVRELRNALERTLLFSDNSVLSAQWLQLEPPFTNASHALGCHDDNSLSIPLDGSLGLDDLERLIIEKMLKRNNNNVTATANALSTTRETIRYRIKKYGLEVS